MGRIQNAWELSKKSWAVLSKDRELIAIPIIAGLASMLVGGVIFFPIALSMGAFDESSSTGPALYLIGFIASVASAWVLAIGQAAVVAGAAQRMDGQDPTIGTAYAQARDRAVRLLEWAFMATVVAIVLDIIEERLGIIGKMVSWIGSIAFSVMSFLALPIILFEDVGAIEGFKRSSAMLKGTWGEQVSFNFGMGLLSMVAAIPAVIAFVAAASVGGIVLLFGAVIALVWLITVVAVTSTLSSVFKAALYRWAKGLPVDPVFDTDDFRGAFGAR